jgi:predicted dehydrogenase
VADARALVDASTRRDRVLMVDHTYLFSPAVRGIASALAAGAIGRPASYTSRRFNAGRVRSDAAVHWDLASHDLAILDYLFASAPTNVAATRLDGRSTGAATGVRITIAYSGGFAATLESNWIAPVKARQVTIVGTGGRIDYDDLATKDRLVVRTRGRRAFVPALDNREPLHAALGHFVGCIEGREPPLAGGRAGLDVVRLLEAADRSLAHGGRPVRVENEAEAA